MDFVNSIILGIVQGLTEFIPVSSSGHLILAREILGLELANSLAFDAVLQLATTLAVLVYFRKDIFGYIKTFFKLITAPFCHPRTTGINSCGDPEVSHKQKTLLYAIILGTIPAVVIGFLLEDSMDNLFRNPTLVAGSLIVGGIIMWWAEKRALSFLNHRHKLQQESMDPRLLGDDKQGVGRIVDGQITSKKGIGIGFFQALALIPGFSRSGMTISGGLFLGLNRIEATRFSFLLAFPVLFGSGMKKLFDLGSSGLLESVGGPLLVGSIVSFVVGLLAIHFLVSYLKKHTLNAFVLYRIFLAVIVLIFV